jgi:metal-dependent amidase/aminoacylase/carboxypeptidase family protein
MSLASMGGEDFAYYLEKIPGCFWFMNTQAPDRDIRFPNHHPRFDLDESFLGDFAAVNLEIARALAARMLAGTIPDTTDA